MLLNANKAVVPSRQAEPLRSCEGWRSQLVALHVDSRRVKPARHWRPLGHGRKCKNMYLSCTLYLRHRAQTQAFSQLSYRFHFANFSIVMNHVFVLLTTVHARSCHCNACFLTDWVEGSQCSPPGSNDVTAQSVRWIFGVCIQRLVALVRSIHATAGPINSIRTAPV